MASTSAYSRNSYSRHGRVPSSTGGRPHIDILEAEEETNDAPAGSTTIPGSARGGGGSSRQEMLERQRELQKNKTRNRMAGGVVKPHSSLDAQAGSAYGGGRGRTVPQYSAPQQRPGGQAGPSSPVKNSAGSGGGSSLAPAKQEEEPQSTETPSVEDVLRNRASRKSSRPEPKQASSPTVRAMNERNIQSTYDPNPESVSTHGASSGARGSRSQDTGRQSSNTANKEGEQPIQPRGDASESTQSVVPDYPFDFSDMRSFLTKPLPIDAGVVQCYIERKKTGLKWMYPEYYLYMKNDDRFLLAAKKRSKQKTSNYLMSMDKGDMSRDSPNFLGKVRSNLMGTEFIVYDDGQNPSKASNPEEVREELGVVTYASHLFSTKGPRKMKAAVPVVDPGNNERVPFKPGEHDESMADLFKDGHIQDMVVMVNKPPKWNEYVGAYVLNFSGRVTMASVKNFQLVTPEDHDRVILQFGRTAKDLFTMDVRWPLSPLQAFGICVSSFDYKLACD
eukprot:gb/GECG01015724.1/.p1 GENE.gb/GECG01015724.1/~~gb/GECG01015724.1/.p1  ORF type:complete len:505 (+),score=67.99 gb/GECG01015724.1/:1-1515(+)